MDPEAPNAGRSRSNEEIDRNDVVAAVDAVVVFDAVPNILRPPDIFKLNIDCFKDVFDYLAMKDLISVGKTCKTLQEVAGHCFRRTYPNFETNCGCKGIICDVKGMDVSHFIEFVPYARFCGRIGASTFLKVQSKLRRLKELEIISAELANEEIDCMKETFGKLEVMRLSKCTWNASITFSHVIALCTKLGRLEIDKCVFDKNWLVQKCPTLNCLKFIQDEVKRVDGLVTFLRLNPNIRKLITSVDVLRTNRDSFKNYVGLDELVVKFGLCSISEFRSRCCLLRELHAHGFYHRLRLNSVYVFELEMFDQLTQLNGLVKLELEIHVLGALSALTNLQEIIFNYSYFMPDSENGAINLMNLERLYFGFVHLNGIVPFIRRSISLRIIMVLLLEGCSMHNRANVVDLVRLNRERGRLANARKITFYVHETVYLATKWALKETDFDFIRLKRIDSSEWNISE